MRFSTPILLAASLIGSVLAQNTQHIPVGSLIAGIDSETREVPARRNINDLHSERGPMLTLFLRGLAAFQDTDPTDPRSYFQIAGIHGYPAMEWNGGGVRRSNHIGYCPHGEEIFATWHRHYLALYEQILFSHVRRIAQEYPEDVRDEYLRAADRFRIPYWDWAENTDVPPITTRPEVTVMVPSGNGSRVVERTIPNPLFDYRFPEAAIRGDFGFIAPRRTLRCPDSNGVSHPEDANDPMRDLGIRQAVYNTFMRSTTFSQAMSLRTSSASFEGPHGTIHNYAACGQTFASVPMSGFEPLFMLHHANVDRLMALWQAMYPENDMFTESYPSRGTYAIEVGSTISPSTPLNPFYSDNEHMHTSLSARGIWNFGYTYPGIAFWNTSRVDIQREVINLVHTMYGSGVSDGRTSQRREAREAKRRAMSKRKLTEAYFIRLEVEVEKFERPCQINVLIGGTVAGTIPVLEMPQEGAIGTEIPLEDVLEVNKMYDYDVPNFVEFIAKNTHIQILQPEKQTIYEDTKFLDYIHMEIIEETVIPPHSTYELPRFDLVNSQKAQGKLLTVKPPSRKLADGALAMTHDIPDVKIVV